MKKNLIITLLAKNTGIFPGSTNSHFNLNNIALTVKIINNRENKYQDKIN